MSFIPEGSIESLSSLLTFDKILLSVFDIKARLFYPPMMFATTDAAIRDFASLLKDSKHAFHNNPADYSLFVVGKFDTKFGFLSPSKPALIYHGTKGVVSSYTASTYLPDPALEDDLKQFASDSSSTTFDSLLDNASGAA